LVIDELGQAMFELTWQIVVLEQDLVVHGAVVPFDLALAHRISERSRVPTQRILMASMNSIY
jgi:hypothetical protein